MKAMDHRRHFSSLETRLLLSGCSSITPPDSAAPFSMSCSGSLSVETCTRRKELMFGIPSLARHWLSNRALNLNTALDLTGQPFCLNDLQAKLSMNTSTPRSSHL